MTVEIIKTKIEQSIKDHKKSLRRKDKTEITEAMLKGSLMAYESLLLFIEQSTTCPSGECTRNLGVK